MKRCAHRQQHGPFCAMFLGKLYGAFNRRLMAGYDDLGWVIIICGFADLVTGGLLCDLARCFKIKPKKGSHRADPNWNRSLHRFTARTKKPRRIRDAQRTRDGKSRIFTQRMSGNKIRSFNSHTFACQCTRCSKGSCHQSWLGVFGQGQNIYVTFPDQFAQGFAKCIIHFFKNLL